jgi:hypothetical protein
MRENRLEGRLADAMRAASEALREAAYVLEEMREGRGSLARDGFGRDERDDRAWAPERGGNHDDARADTEESSAGAPPLPPYPPFPPYPPYPPMPPIIIACGGACRHGGGGFPGSWPGFGASWPSAPFGAAYPSMQGAAAAGQGAVGQGAAVAPYQPPAPVPAGGIVFSAAASAEPETPVTNPDTGSPS